MDSADKILEKRKSATRQLNRITNQVEPYDYSASNPSCLFKRGQCECEALARGLGGAAIESP